MGIMSAYAVAQYPNGAWRYRKRNHPRGIQYKRQSLLECDSCSVKNHIEEQATSPEADMWQALDRSIGHHLTFPST